MKRTFSQEFYCGLCFGYVGPTGKRIPYADDDDSNTDVIVWVECLHCLGRRLAGEAAEEERRRREEELRRPRECQLEGCAELFVPGTRWQAFCCDEHRWAAHRLRHAAARVNGSAAKSRAS